MAHIRSICIITSGHITTCPRMMKAAEAFHDAGYRVRIVCSSSVDWLDEADARFLASRSWYSSVVRFGKGDDRFNYYRSGIRLRLARRRVQRRGAGASSLALLGAAFTRSFSELVDAAAAVPADLYYSGTAGGIAVAAATAFRTARRYALDLEDFHSAEQDPSPWTELSHQIIGEIERRTLPEARFLTCGSEAMADAYRNTYGLRPVPINNVFPLPGAAPDFEIDPGQLRVVWLSQTVGAGRGIEDAIMALGLTGRPARLLLRGQAVPGYLEKISDMARAHAPNVELRHAVPDMSTSVVDLCRGHDVGLALEQMHVLNRAVCLCNKPFTYMLAGLAVAFTNTPGQRALASDLGRGALLFEVGQTAALAEGLKRWASDPVDLLAARRAAWGAAVRRWHWDHPAEKGRLLGLVRAASDH